MTRFALLYHDHPTPHYDFMLERQGVLWTWRVPVLFEDGVPLVAERIGDHRLHYLAYEGPVSGDRGTVTCVDRGNLQWLDVTEQVLRVHLSGTTLRGIVEGTRQSEGIWCLVYRADSSASHSRPEGANGAP